MENNSHEVILGERGRVEIGHQAVWLSESLLSPLLGRKLVLYKCHCIIHGRESGSPKGVIVELRPERALAIFHSLSHSGGEKGKAEAKLIVDTTCGEGLSWKSQVGRA